MRIKPRRTKSHKRIIGITKHRTNRFKKEVVRMTMAIKIKDSTVELEENTNFNCMSNIRKIAQMAIKEKGLTNKEIRKTLGIKRYEI